MGKRKGIKGAAFHYIIPICLSGLMILLLHDFFVVNTSYYQLAYDTGQGEEFRAMCFSDGGLACLFSLADEWGEDPYDVITTAMIDQGYCFTGTAKGLSHLQFEQLYTGIQNQKPVEYRKLRNDYEALLSDLACFPVLLDPVLDQERLTYENSWGDPRTYGGDRRHEGIDLMDRENKRGCLPIVSMTDGTVTKLGWLELGGYRVGVTSPSGSYFYYAHLASYAEGLKEGATVKAGQLIGFMGDTGYSSVEGTTGNFDVHLHVGMYLHDGTSEEISVNPYWILKYLEEKTIEYRYREVR